MDENFKGNIPLLVHCCLDYKVIHIDWSTCGLTLPTSSVYISGSLGTSYVPGRVAGAQQIFVSSLPHVIASTVLIIVLFVMGIGAQFRPRKGDQINLTNIAAVLADSGLPRVAKAAKVNTVTREKRVLRCRWFGSNAGQEVSRKLGKWKVSLEHSAKADGLEMLHVSRG